MATYSRDKLSGSTNGKGIKVAANATPGTTIHTAVTGTDDYDEIWLWAVNSYNLGSIKLTLEYGGTSDPDNLIEVTIPPESGLVLVCPGLVLNNEQVLAAFAASANYIVLYGYVNKIES